MDKKTVIGVVVECLPNNLYKVVLEDEKEVLCYVSGKVRVNKIRVLVGDGVEVELDPYKGKTTNRIVKRL